MLLDIDNKDWDEFFIEDISTIKPGKRLTKANMTHGVKPFIGSSDSNNGITEFVSNTNASEDSNVLGVNYNGSVVENFYHPYKAIFTDDVKRLSLKDAEGNKYLYLFLKNAILKQKGKYQYAYKFNEKRLKRQKIMLPVSGNCQPDYDYMEQYIKALLQKKKEEYKEYSIKALEQLKHKEINALEDKEWGEFFIEEIADIISGKDIYDTERTSGNTPYISSTSKNNGISHFVGNNNQTLERKCLSVNRNGSVGFSFYHHYEALFSNDCRKLRPRQNSKYIAFFIANQITKQKEKYNYGYKMGTGRLKRQKIMLPISSNGQPDYEYMEQYIKNLEYVKRKKYLEFQLKTKSTGQV